jgi:RNA polymerase sigma-70 factor (ECF subfamily)
MDLDPEILDGYRRKLRYKARYQLGSFCPDVDDVVQETLTRFVTALKDNKIHNPDNIGGFLSGVCNNVILEYRRRLWREAGPEPPGPPHEASVAAEAGAVELRDAIQAALNQLSDRDCEILTAFFIQERDKAEICRTTGLTDAQFRVALFRAKDRFRKIYRDGLKQTPPDKH